MKKILSILFTIASITLLIGCQATEQTQQIQENNAQSNNTTATPESDSSIITPSIEKTAEISEVDAAAYTSALELMDTSFCDKVLDNDYKEKCTNSINDKKIIETAVSKMDEAICETMSSEEQIAVCNVKVEAAQKSKELMLEKIKENEATMKLSNEILEEGDLAGCAKLGEKYVASCEIDILLNQAFAQNDSAICEQATSTETVTICKDRFNAQAVKNEPDES